MENTFSWELENFSSFRDDKCYYSPPFTVAGCKWGLVAYPKGHRGYGYFSVYLGLFPGSLSPAWRRDVKFRITLVNKTKSNKVSAIVVPQEPVKISAALNTKEGYQASHASASNSQIDFSCQEAQKSLKASYENLDDDNASEEGLDEDYTSEEVSDDDDDASKEDSDDDGDASSSVSDDEGRDISPLNESNALEDASHTVGTHGIRCNSVASETEVSNGESEDVDDEASYLAWNESARNASSLDQVKSLEDASQTMENGGRGLNTVASVTETSNDVLKEFQPVKETIDVNGFEVVSSQVESVRLIFERHPDIAVEFRAKNQLLRNTCMNFLLSLIETLCQSLEELSNEDLVEADIALTYLKDAGFKVDWLEKKLDQLKENKEKEQFGLTRLQEIEENLLKLKQKCSELDALAGKEKAELSATRTYGVLQKQSTDNNFCDSVQSSIQPKSILYPIDPWPQFKAITEISTNRTPSQCSRRTICTFLEKSQTRIHEVQSARHIFERHPDIAVEFRAKNKHLRTTSMNFLISLIETLYQPLQELSNEDLVEGDIALTYLKDVGFKVDWLEKKLDQLKEKKKKERSCEARVQEIEAQLHDLKHKFEREKAELSATRTPLSFDDIV